MAFPIAPQIDDTYVAGSGQEYVWDGTTWTLTVGSAAVNALALNNTTVFTPTGDYNPATKKYVDDNAGSQFMTATPTISISLSVNEGSTTVGTITNYDSQATYTFSNNVEYTSGSTFSYTAPAVIDGDDDIDTITVYATKAGELRSETLNTSITIVYVPIVADTAIQVVDFTNEAQINDGWSLI